jgi:site-specific DNA recombinase
MTGRKTLSHGKDFYNYVCQKNYAGAKSKGCGRMMSENKLNKFVWDNLIKLLEDPEKINKFTEDQPTNHIEEELAHLDSEINRIKKGRKQLYTLVSLGKDDDLDLEEIKDQIRDSQIKEKELKAKYNQLSNEIKVKPKENSYFGLNEAIEEYMEKKTKELSIEDKQHIIRLVVKEITIIDSENVHIQLF